MSSQYVGEGGASSSQSDNTSQGSRKEERVWSLKDCEMQVVGLGKRDQKDDFMTQVWKEPLPQSSWWVSMMVIVKRSLHKWDFWKNVLPYMKNILSLA